MLNLHGSMSMKDSKVWIGLCAAVALSGCATELVSSWKAPDAEPFRMRGEKVAAVVMVSDQTIRLAGEDALARELRARGTHIAIVPTAKYSRVAPYTKAAPVFSSNCLMSISSIHQV